MKDILRKCLRACGYDVVKVVKTGNASSEDELVKTVIAKNIDVIFDIGANVGQYAVSLRKNGYKGRIVSFEPLQQPFGVLKKLAEGDPDWYVYNCALGSCSATLQMNVSKNVVSSSFLDVESTSLEMEPAIGYVGVQETHVDTLDSYFVKHYRPGERVFLKLDVQGYEEQVLLGAPETLRQTYGLQMEMSIVPVYRNERLMHEMVGYLKQQGFYLFGLGEVFSDHRTGRLIQVDGLFFRE